MTRLSAGQMDILQWIADGCPERDWADFSHRISARSLANRDLVQVRGHGPTWTAKITQAGRALLSGEGDMTPGPPRRVREARERRRTKR